ncbi:MAG TPA: uroporphyrinogen-III synthase [Gemmataceae bacterium]|nr:uroporphyrinogen-III synthase [Gemmataceae bacterium]
MAGSLEGRTVALAEGRQLEELAGMLEKEGATPLRCPMVSILDAPDPAPVQAWLRELVLGRFDYVVFLTGEGVRRLLGQAERDGTRDQVIAALQRTSMVTRGPKPVQALREVGLAPALVAQEPTTDGVIAVLRPQPLQGRTVGVQFYSESNPPLTEFLQGAGARVQSVLPYVYAPAADAGRVVDLIERLARGGVDVIVFTSSPQVDRLYEVARERGLEEPLRQGLQRTCVAAVGPVVAVDLRRHGAPVHVCPEQGFVMKNLVRQIERTLAGEGT